MIGPFLSLESAFKELLRIHSWPNVALVFGFVIVVGYCLRFWRWFPNDAIATVVILSGAIGMMLLAERAPEEIPARAWHMKNFIVGCIIGFVAWGAHAIIMKRFEEWVAERLPSIISKKPKGRK